ncbi:Hypothetical predicted protein [Octopus vulgaris]|uniref:Uncharacterized protein n=1 Tax=Octopus vulgaris TaxID=6645 RepID=A0AA36AX50_OCTVU|nr:Hypothetical predicted protein [Octopus vulgaris]
MHTALRGGGGGDGCSVEVIEFFGGDCGAVTTQDTLKLARGENIIAALTSAKLASLLTVFTESSRRATELSREQQLFIG